MNAYDRKILLQAYKRNISELLKAGNEKRLENEYKEKQADYFRMIERKEKGINYSESLTAYISKRYQAVSDAFIFKIDPLTGLKA